MCARNLLANRWLSIAIYSLASFSWLWPGTIGSTVALAEEVDPPTVEGQPLGANVLRVVRAFDYLGAPLPSSLVKELVVAARERDSTALQSLLAPYVLAEVSINPELRVKVAPGKGKRNLQQGGFTPKIIKILNDATIASPLRISSPQAGPVYAGAARRQLGHGPVA